jgi:hypothetical protein
MFSVPREIPLSKASLRKVSRKVLKSDSGATPIEIEGQVRPKRSKVTVEIRNKALR